MRHREAVCAARAKIGLIGDEGYSNDFGSHHCLNSSGVVHALNTMRAGPLKVRVTTSSRSDFRSTLVSFFMAYAHFRFL